MHSGNAAAMPPARNEATLSFCQTSRSVRITTAILVSNCMDNPQCHSGAMRSIELRCAISHRIISRFRVWSFGPARNDGEPLPLGVAGPGADHAFLAAEFIAFFGRGVERAGNP